MWLAFFPIQCNTWLFAQFKIPAVNSYSFLLNSFLMGKHRHNKRLFNVIIVWASLEQVKAWKALAFTCNVHKPGRVLPRYDIEVDELDFLFQILGGTSLSCVVNGLLLASNFWCQSLFKQVTLCSWCVLAMT